VAILSRRLLAVASLLLLASGGARPLCGGDTTSREHALRAAFLFNFLRFVEWPPDARPAPTICVAEPGEDAAAVERALAGKQVDGREVRVRALSSPDARDCAILFVPEASRDAWPAVHERIGCRPVLTVGESAVFLEKGGSIAVFADANRLRFDVNRNAAACSGLRFSSRLLSLARTVDGRQAER
jgi:hypothetical protein